MTKITVDKALIEQAIAALHDQHDESLFVLRHELQKALSEPVVKDCLTTEPAADPVGWSITWHGDHTGNFYQSRETAEVRMIEANRKYPGEVRAIAPLYASPPPAEVPMLSDEENKKLRENWVGNLDDLVREVEAAVRQKAGIK